MHHLTPHFLGCSSGQRSRARAFSLIEVVLALGIISFALIALIGMTVVGTNAGREGKNDTDYGYLFEQIVGQLRTKPFNLAQAEDESRRELFPLPALNVNTTAPAEFYLDDQNLLTTSSQANKQVRISVQSPLPLDEARAPALAGAYPHRAHLAYVSVEISRFPLSQDKFETSTYFAEICPLQE